MDIITLTRPIRDLVGNTTTRQLIVIIEAMLAMTGQVTMLGISRWTEGKGSYRTIQRFFKTKINWVEINVQFFLSFRYKSQDEVAIAGDHTVITKSGKETHGLDYFFSSIYNKTVKGLEFFALALVNVSERKASPVLLRQTLRSQEPQKKDEPKQTSKKRGRPKGSKNKNHRDVELPAYLQHIFDDVARVQRWVGQRITIRHLLLDGAFGNNNALQMARRLGLHLVSKLRCDAALYFVFDGQQKSRGAPRKYGRRIDIRNLDQKYLQKTEIKDDVETKIYGFQALSRAFPDVLNIAVIAKRNLKTGKMAYAILFSSDLTLTSERLVDLYSLRFQIEFNFRDAKQFWGLEDFMNVQEQQVTNAANLAMFMVNLSHVLASERQLSILDLKSHYRGRKYVAAILNYLPELPETILIDELFANVGTLGSIHAISTP